MTTTTNDTKTKKVFIDLWGHETLLQFKRLVAEVPADCSKEDIEEVDGIDLEEFSCNSVSDAHWETEGAEDFEVDREVGVE